jgi:hypothetical protein
MARLVDPYMRLFKADNPIAHQGCGPGMYSEGSPAKMAGVNLDIDVFAIPAAFVSGVWGYVYRGDVLVLHPALPAGVNRLVQKFPARWGGAQLFLTLQRLEEHTGDLLIARRVEVNGTECGSCIAADGSVSLPWAAAMEGAATAVVVTVANNSTETEAAAGTAGARSGGAPSAAAENTGSATELSGAAAARAAWEADEAARGSFHPGSIADPRCVPNATVASWAANASHFGGAMAAAGLGGRFEAAQARGFLAALNVTVARCAGRADGSIAPLPRQPAGWDGKYNMSYNQTLVELYFDDVVGRVWRGLGRAVGSYDRGNASPEQALVLGLFRGAPLEALRAAGRAAARRALDRRVAAAERELAGLRAQRDAAELEL